MKKFMAMVLVVISLLTVTAFAENAVLDESQKEELYYFGIMTGDENGDLRLNDNITRAEVTKMICVAGNVSPKEPDANETLFPDVLQEHWAYKYIYAAKNKGIIIGDENGCFNPEDNVTNEEIIKMIICLLGYEPMAETRGGYPAGYTSQASRLGLTDGMTFEVNVPAIRNDVAVMMHRALDVPLMEKVEDSEEFMYVILDGNGNERKTLSSEILSVIK